MTLFTLIPRLGGAVSRYLHESGAWEAPFDAIYTNPAPGRRRLTLFTLIPRLAGGVEVPFDAICGARRFACLAQPV